MCIYIQQPQTRYIHPYTLYFKHENTLTHIILIYIIIFITYKHTLPLTRLHGTHSYYIFWPPTRDFMYMYTPLPPYIIILLTHTHLHGTHPYHISWPPMRDYMCMYTPLPPCVITLLTHTLTWYTPIQHFMTDHTWFRVYVHTLTSSHYNTFNTLTYMLYDHT